MILVMIIIKKELKGSTFWLGPFLGDRYYKQALSFLTKKGREGLGKKHETTLKNKQKMRDAFHSGNAMPPPQTYTHAYTDLPLSRNGDEGVERKKGYQHTVFVVLVTELGNGRSRFFSVALHLLPRIH